MDEVMIFGLRHTRIFAKNTMMKPELEREVNDLHAEICAALADPKRIMILYALAEAPRNVGDLGETLSISQPSTSRHLKVLRERGLVETVRKGPTIEYSLADLRLIEALDLLRAVLRDTLSRRGSLAEAIG